MMTSIKFLAIIVSLSGCLEAGPIQKLASVARARARKPNLRNTRRLRPLKLSRALSDDDLSSSAGLSAALPRQAYRLISAGFEGRKLMTPKRTMFSRQMLASSRGSFLLKSRRPKDVNNTKRLVAGVRQFTAKLVSKRKQKAQIRSVNKNQDFFSEKNDSKHVKSQKIRFFNRQKSNVIFAAESDKFLKATSQIGDSDDSIQSEDADTLTFPLPPTSAIYEAGDFNNVHISNLLLAAKQIEEALNFLFRPLNPQTQGLLSKGLKSNAENANRSAIHAQFEQFAIFSRKSLALVRVQITRIEAWLDSIHLNFHNVLHFFELVHDRVVDELRLREVEDDVLFLQHAIGVDLLAE